MYMPNEYLRQGYSVFPLGGADFHFRRAPARKGWQEPRAEVGWLFRRCRYKKYADDDERRWVLVEQLRNLR